MNSSVSEYSPQQVINWLLNEVKVPKSQICSDIWLSYKVSGKILMKLDDELLQGLEVSDQVEREKILSSIYNLVNVSGHQKSPQKESKRGEGNYRGGRGGFQGRGGHKHPKEEEKRIHDAESQRRGSDHHGRGGSRGGGRGRGRGVDHKPPYEEEKKLHDEGSQRGGTDHRGGRGGHKPPNEERKKQEKTPAQQIEYYFSDQNLEKDEFLRDKISAGDDGYIEISILLTFNQVKKAGINKIEGIIEACKDSTLLQFSSDGQRIRREDNKPLPQFKGISKKKYIQKCHFYQVNGCKTDCKMEHIEPKGFGVCLIEKCIYCQKFEFNLKSDTLEFMELQGIKQDAQSVFQSTFDHISTLKVSIKNHLQNNQLETVEQLKKEYKILLKLFRTCQQQLEKSIVTNKKITDETLKLQLSMVELKKFKQNLPAYAHRDEIIKEMYNKKNKFSLLIGHTGSGKSTQIPQYLLLNLIQNNLSKTIYCVLPRKVAARSLALRITEEIGDIGGKKVGYDFGKSDSNVKQGETQLIITTERQMLKKLIRWKNKFIENKQQRPYFLSSIFLDEVHERSFFMDIILGTIKQTEALGLFDDHFKVILASATINESVFQNFLGGCNIFRIEGTTHPILDEYRPPQNEDQILDQVVSTLEEILVDKQKGLTKAIYGHILVFLDTIPNIDSVHKSIAELLQKDFVPSEYVILPLHGMITPEEQQKVFEPHFVESLDKYATKIILANKIAESSITIDGVTVVIDTGLAKEATYDPVRKITTIETEFISRAQAIQRRGRAGRTAVGICYRIYSEEDFLNLPPDKEPEIKKTNLDTVILKIMSLGIQVQDFELLDPLDPRVVEHGYTYLEQIGAIQNRQLTEKGQLMCDFPTEPRFSNVILQAYKRDCLDNVIRIISLLPFAGQLFFRPKGQQLQESEFSKNLKSSHSDLIMLDELLLLYSKQGYKTQGQFCKSNGLIKKSLALAYEALKENQKEINNAQKYSSDKKFFEKDEAMAKEELQVRLAKCFFSSFFNNISQLQLSKWNTLQCADLRFRPDMNSAMRDLLKSKPLNFECFFLEMRSFGQMKISQVNQQITNDIKQDQSVVSNQILDQVEAEKKALFDEFDPQQIELSNSDFPKWFRLYRNKLKDLTTKYDVSWQHEDNNITVIGRKAIEGGVNDAPNTGQISSISQPQQSGKAEQIWNQIVYDLFKWVGNYQKQQAKQMHIAQLEDSEIRFTFDVNFQIKDILEPEEFVKMSIDGLPSSNEEQLVQMIGVKESALSYVQSIEQKDGVQLNLLFLDKQLAKTVYEQLQNKRLPAFSQLKCRPQKLISRNRFRESVYIKIQWQMFASHGTAAIHFENDLDPVEVVRSLTRQRMKAVVDKKKSSSVYIRNIDKKWDEQDIKQRLPDGLFGWPKVVVHRDDKKDTYELMQNYNESFTDFLTDNHLLKYLGQTTFECKRGSVTANFRVDDVKEGQRLVDRFDDKCGIIGEQKVRVQLKSQVVQTIQEDVFHIVQERFDSLVKELTAKHLKDKLKIYTVVPKFKDPKFDLKKISVFVASQNNLLNAQVSSRIQFLLFDGEPVADLYMINKKRNKFFNELQEKFKDLAAFKGSNKQGWRIFTKSEDISTEIKNYINLELESIKQQFQSKMKAKPNKGGKEERECILYCGEQQNLFELTCGCCICKDCLNEYITSTCFDKDDKDHSILSGVKCPMDPTRHGNIRLDIIKDSLGDSFDKFVQKVMKKYIQNLELNKIIKGCWTPGCPKWFMYTGQKYYQCNGCFKTWCLKTIGKVDPHEHHPEIEDCKKATDKAQINEELFNQNELKLGKIITSNELAKMKEAGNEPFRRCPKCDNPTFHGGSCLHMTCKCGCHWCFFCGRGPFPEGIYVHMRNEHGDIY